MDVRVERSKVNDANWVLVADGRYFTFGSEETAGLAARRALGEPVGQLEPVGVEFLDMLMPMHPLSEAIQRGVI
jgi:hypothetical protein